MTHWIGTWATSAAAPVYFVPQEIMAQPTPLAGTLRHRLRTSVGGRRLRLTLSNETGVVPLPIGGVSIGPRVASTPWDAQRLHRLTFGGETAFAIAAGVAVCSDPLDLGVGPLAEMIVSVFFPQPFTPARSEGVHWAQHVADLDRVMALTLPEATALAVRPTVTAMAVEADHSSGVIVCLGDSLTDGAGASSGDFRSWTDILARRLQSRHGDAAPAVVNAGIGGNQLIGTLIGPSALDRLDGDVFATPGVSQLIVFEGINDIGAGGRTTMEGVVRPVVTAPALIAGYQQIIARARARNIRVAGATLLPFRGSLFFLEEKEDVRLAVNHWIRSSAAFDQVIDFEAVLRDARDPSQLNPAFDSGDFMHPNAAGQLALGEAIDLGLFPAGGVPPAG